MSAQDLHVQLRDTGIGIATIYRILKKGVQNGELVSVALPGGPKRFSTPDKPRHHHFECEQCDTVFDVAGTFDQLDELIPAGFKLEQHEIILTGRCRECVETINPVE